MIEERLEMLAKAVARLRHEVVELRQLVGTAAANAEMLYQTCRRRGEVIEILRQHVDRLLRHHDTER